MALIKAGEIERLGILYEKYKMPLYAYFFKLTGGDKQEAEDLAHTVFFRVIKYKSTFTGQGSFPQWLFRIAHNTGIDYHRRNKLIKSYNNETKTTQPGTTEDSDMEKSEEIETLRKAMRMLQPGEREILILGKINCISYREIAGILNITESNVKIRIFRALKRLREHYDKIDR